jgi:chromosome segregation ATPase
MAKRTGSGRDQSPEIITQNTPDFAQMLFAEETQEQARKVAEAKSFAAAIPDTIDINPRDFNTQYTNLLAKISATQTALERSEDATQEARTFLEDQKTILSTAFSNVAKLDTQLKAVQDKIAYQTPDAYGVTPSLQDVAQLTAKREALETAQRELDHNKTLRNRQSGNDDAPQIYASEIEAQEKRVSKLTAEVQKLNARIQEMNSPNLSALESQKIALLDRQSNAQNNLAVASGATAKAQATYDRAVAQQAELKTELTNLESRKRDVDRGMQSIKRYAELQKRHNELSRDLETGAGDYQKAKKALADLPQAIRQTEQALQTLDTANKRSTKDISSSQKALNAATKERAVRGTAETKPTTYQKVVNARAEQLLQEQDAIQKQIETLSSRKTYLKTQQALAPTALKDDKPRNTTYTNQITQIDAALKEQREKLSRVEQALKTHLDSNQRTIERLDQKVANAQAALTAKKSQKEEELSRSSDRETISKRLAALKTQLSEAQQTIKTYEAEKKELAGIKPDRALDAAGRRAMQALDLSQEYKPREGFMTRLRNYVTAKPGASKEVASRPVEQAPEIQKVSRLDYFAQAIKKASLKLANNLRDFFSPVEKPVSAPAKTPSGVQDMTPQTQAAFMAALEEKFPEELGVLTKRIAAVQAERSTRKTTPMQGMNRAQKAALAATMQHTQTEIAQARQNLATMSAALDGVSRQVKQTLSGRHNSRALQTSTIQKAGSLTPSPTPHKQQGQDETRQK